MKVMKLKILYLFEYEIGEVSRESEIDVLTLVDYIYNYFMIRNDLKGFSGVNFNRLICIRSIIPNEYLKLRSNYLAIQVMKIYLDRNSSIRSLWLGEEIRNLYEEIYENIKEN